MKSCLQVTGKLQFNKISMKRFINAARWPTIIVVGFIILPYLGYAFRAVPWLFMAVWLACPLSMWLMSRIGYEEHALDLYLTPSGFKVAGNVITGIAVIIAMDYFAHYYWLRDQIGYTLWDSYSSTPSMGMGDYGEEIYVRNAEVDGLVPKVVLWLFSASSLALVLGLPLLTRTIASKAGHDAEVRNYDEHGKEWRESVNGT